MTERTLFVILGAGGSRDCAAPDSVEGRGTDWLRPPLVTELFAHRFAPILREYPLAQHAAPEIRHATESAVSLETFLRESYRDSADPDHQAVFRLVPIYLQHLLWEVSTKWAEQPDWYDLLIAMSLRHFARVVFVTLNYDILLDSRLHRRSELRRLDSYISLSDQKRWALVKLHGSVTWRRKILNSDGFSFAAPPDGLELGDIQHRFDVDLQSLRSWTEGNHTGPAYPALSVPLGPRDELNCPPDHVDFLLRQFRDQANEGLNALVIGYSAYDQAVVRLLQESEVEFRHLTVVGRNREGAQAVIERLAEHVPARYSEAAVAPFGTFARDGSLSTFLHQVSQGD